MSTRPSSNKEHDNQTASDNNASKVLPDDQSNFNPQEVARLAMDRVEQSDDTMVWLRLAAERLSLVRYVFLVQIEDGIASAEQQSALEYADAVLIGWPSKDDDDAVQIDSEMAKDVARHMRLGEEYIDRFRQAERASHIDEMTAALIRVSEQVAEIRKIYQPTFPLPTFAEIRRVIQDEWDEAMGKIDVDASESQES